VSCRTLRNPQTTPHLELSLNTEGHTTIVEVHRKSLNTGVLNTVQPKSSVQPPGRGISGRIPKVGYQENVNNGSNTVDEDQGTADVAKRAESSESSLSDICSANREMN
jgi:hypothetical protein